jgi:hypothetical protein
MVGHWSWWTWQCTRGQLTMTVPKECRLLKYLGLSNRACSKICNILHVVWCNDMSNSWPTQTVIISIKHLPDRLQMWFKHKFLTVLLIHVYALRLVDIAERKVLINHCSSTQTTHSNTVNNFMTVRCDTRKLLQISASVTKLHHKQFNRS